MLILEAMKQYRDLGLCPIPVCGKKPMLLDWTGFQSLPTDAMIDSWPNLRTKEGGVMDGVGLVTGKISGGLVCLDLDTKNDPTVSMVQEFLDLLKAMNATAIVDACVGQKTPSKGYHMIFRCPEIHDGNQVFAKSDKTKKAVIETRGQGGQFVAYPSPGYSVIKGNFADVRRLSLRDAEILFSAARAVDRLGPIHHVEAKPPATFKASGEITPIDDYNAKATVDMMEAEVEGVGFVRLRQVGPNIHYRRPGKSGRDTSATLHVEKRTFYVFTTSTDLEANKGYSAAALLCYLHHNGDWSETARQLRKAGYGSPKAKAPAPTAAAPQPPATQEAAPAPSSNGSGVIIIPPATLRDQVLDLHRRPFQPGESTGWPGLDKYLRIKKRRLNLVTGIPGAGKSSLLNHLFMNLAFGAAKWRIAIFSPESESPADLVANLCEIHSGKPFFGRSGMTDPEVEKTAAEISERFILFDQEMNGATFEALLQAAAEVKPDALLLDPWNRITHVRDSHITETEYIGACLAKAAAFTKKHDLSLWIVAHPQKVKRDQKTGEIQRPGLYDISGSANWANMADNAIMIWRDYKRSATEIEVIKVRGKRDGEVGLATLKFEKEIGRFRDWTAADDFTIPTPQGGDSSGYRAPGPSGSLPSRDLDEKE